MTPKERANLLYEKYFLELDYHIENKEKLKELTKELCFLCIIEIILLCNNIELFYWSEVKKEIENL